MNFTRWIEQQEDNLPNPRNYYLACVLTAPAQHLLFNEVNHQLSKFTSLQNVPTNWIKVCHHMTVNFNPTLTDLKDSRLGKQILLNVIGLSIDENAVAVVVSSNLEVKNDIPHITVAHSTNVKPFYSNQLLKSSKIHPLHLGSIDSEFLAVDKGKNGYWPEPSVALASYTF